MNTPIDVLTDCNYVKRWSMVGTDKESTVASHSFDVAIISMDIRSRMFNVPGIDEKTVCYFALIHDVKESYTGDIPTPTKKGMKIAGFDPDHYSDDHIDEAVPTDKVQAIIKAADLISNYIFISTHGIGTRARAAADEVGGRLREYLDAASEDLRTAATATMTYIIERGSDAVEERERLKAKRETMHRVGPGFKLTSILDRKS